MALSPINLLSEQALGLNLSESEVVQALVESLPGGNWALSIRGQTVNLPKGSGGTAPGQNWVAGQSVLLRASAQADGRWMLQPVAQGAAQAPTSAPAALALAPPLDLPPLSGHLPAAGVSHIANLLYRPSGLGELLQLFQPGLLTDLFEALARPDLQALWEGLQLSLAELRPPDLAMAVAGALGSESGLLRGQGAVPMDPKQLLRRLLSALQQGERSGRLSADTLARLPLVQGALDDLESSQVQAVQAQAQQEVLFSLVLPFKDAEPMTLTFRRRKGQWGEPAPFTVNLHSRSERLGELWLKTVLLGNDRVNLTMWARNTQVVSWAQASSETLRQQLGQAGLHVGSFEIVEGPRPEEGADFVPSGRGLVVDVAV